MRLAGAAPRAAIVGVFASLAGCTLITDSFLTNEFSGDAFPIQVETSSGAIMVGLRQAGQPDRDVVLDLLSPITLIDPGPTAAPSVSFVNLTLLGQRDGALDLPRAELIEAQLVAVHPCSDACTDGGPAGCDPAQCNVGTPAEPRPFTGIVGADVLAGDAVRMRLGDNQLFLLPDIGGSDRGRSLSCDAVFGSPYRGGGTMVIGGTELPFGNRRIALRACLAPELDPRFTVPDVTALTQTGSDALFVVSTGIGVSLLTESAYQRYLRAHPTEQPTETPGVVYLPYGPVSGRRIKIPRLSLVAAATSNALAPCREIYAHRLLTAVGPIKRERCAPDGTVPDRDPADPKFDCVCKDDSEFCSVPATVELAPAAMIEFLVVSDTEPTLQALRTELRPDQAEVDGLLGTDVLRGVEIDVDYPHDRLIARCSTPECIARPQLAEDRDRPQIQNCLGAVTRPE